MNSECYGIVLHNTPPGCPSWVSDKTSQGWLPCNKKGKEITQSIVIQIVSNSIILQFCAKMIYFLLMIVNLCLFSLMKTH